MFDAALNTARDQLRLLISRAGEPAGSIIEFQLALLDDASFMAPVYRSIAAGSSGLRAWQDMLNAEIADYRSGDDEYMEARADDLADLQQRIAAILAPTFAQVELPATGDILLIADHLAPTRFLELDTSRIVGIATAKGNPTSHVSILARSRRIPMIVGCGESLLGLRDGEEALLDADSGTLNSAVAEERDAFAAKLHARERTSSLAEAGRTVPARTASGLAIGVLANLDDLDLLPQFDVEAFDGVGLVRSEFLFQRGDLPDEDIQYQAYRRVLDWAHGRPVTIRLLDAGGDKPIAGVTLPGEANPFLGMRGIRLFRYQPDLFRIQLRALLRAAAHGRLKVMAPMVSVPGEITQLRRELLGQADLLRAAGIPHAIPSLGMMVEVPAAALTAASFEVDFYSIGTNDLTQYAFAAARDEYRLAQLARSDHPALLAMIAAVVTAGAGLGRDVSVCGDMASDPAMIGHLLQAGIRTVSVAPGTVAQVKQAIRQWPAGEGQP